VHLTPPALKGYRGQISRGDQGFAEAEVKVPETFEELVQLFVFYSRIATILFGKMSALMTGIMELIHCIRRDKIVFKTCIAGDKEFATKFMFAIKIRIQRWLQACMT
jgi:hypothetical protein